MPDDLKNQEQSENQEEREVEEETVTLTKSQLEEIIKQAKAKEVEESEEVEVEEKEVSKEEYLLKKVKKFEDIQKNFYNYLEKSLSGLNNAEAIKDFVIERILKGDPLNNIRFMAKKMDEAIEKAKGKDNKRSEVDELFEKLKEKEIASRLEVNVTPTTPRGAMTYREAKEKGYTAQQLEALIKAGKVIFPRRK